jgi:kynurenine 3-monooxygenase
MSLEHYHVLDSSNPVYLARVGYQAAMHRRFPRLYPMDMGKALALTDIPFAELERTQEQHNRWYRLGRM